MTTIVSLNFKLCITLNECEETECQECYGLITEMQTPAESACMDRHKLNCFLASVSPCI